MSIKANPFKRMLGAVGALFSSKSSKQIPSPPTGNKPEHVSSKGMSKYSCSIFPGTQLIAKAKRRKARKVAHNSRMKNFAMAG